ncbi:MAG TPA: glycoside hydrolase family 30 beta sandwich domain-containing protein, partial [Ohtaekwangia sp.]|nr:glycoside hydrolase family 30 beta sandwich domain-containing protein [Ohtaekwangia sp.]
RFIRPGAVHIGAESSDPGVLALAFKHPGTSAVTVILINQTDGEKPVALKLPVNAKKMTWHRTSPSENCMNLGSLSSATITLPAKSISTLASVKGD